MKTTKCINVVLVVCLGTAFIGTPTFGQQPDFSLNGAGFDFDLAHIQGQWIVTEIQVDGTQSDAQIGSRVGDIINISNQSNSGVLIT